MWSSIAPTKYLSYKKKNSYEKKKQRSLEDPI